MHKRSLVMIHGLVGSLQYFSPHERITGATVRSVDLLGYGERRHVPPARLSLAAQADHVVDYLDTLGEEGVWLLGHSMGGAVAILAADQRPGLVGGIINVEGNFTRKDTFWSRKIIEQSPDEWTESYGKMCDDVPGTLVRWRVKATPQRLAWMEHILANQPAGTVYAMARALVDETGDSEYALAVRRVQNRVPMHLVAGEKSAAAWGVPDAVRDAAASYRVQAGVGHLMMLEDPEAFCTLVDSILLLREQ